MVKNSMGGPWRKRRILLAGRLSPAEYQEKLFRYCSAFDSNDARVAAERCLFCYDAPCVKACPTAIDIPLFIRQIAHGQFGRRSQDHFRCKYHGRDVRKGLSHRDVMRGSLRSGICGREAGRDRPIAALCHRCSISIGKADFHKKLRKWEAHRRRGCRSRRACLCAQAFGPRP